MYDFTAPSAALKHTRAVIFTVCFTLQAGIYTCPVDGVETMEEKKVT